MSYINSRSRESKEEQRGYGAVDTEHNGGKDKGDNYWGMDVMMLGSENDKTEQVQELKCFRGNVAHVPRGLIRARGGITLVPKNLQWRGHRAIWWRKGNKTTLEVAEAE